MLIRARQGSGIALAAQRRLVEPLPGSFLVALSLAPRLSRRTGLVFLALLGITSALIGIRLRLVTRTLLVAHLAFRTFDLLLGLLGCNLQAYVLDALPGKGRSQSPDENADGDFEYVVHGCGVYGASFGPGSGLRLSHRRRPPGLRVSVDLAQLALGAMLRTPWRPARVGYAAPAGRPGAWRCRSTCLRSSRPAAHSIQSAGTGVSIGVAD